jgi:hypothetical protein
MQWPRVSKCKTRKVLLKRQQTPPAKFALRKFSSLLPFRAYDLRCSLSLPSWVLLPTFRAQGLRVLQIASQTLSSLLIKGIPWTQTQTCTHCGMCVCVFYVFLSVCLCICLCVCVWMKNSCYHFCGSFLGSSFQIPTFTFLNSLLSVIFPPLVWNCWFLLISWILYMYLLWHLLHIIVVCNLILSFFS